MKNNSEGVIMSNINNDNNNQPKVEKLSATNIKEQVEDEIVDRIMQQILSIK